MRLDGPGGEVVIPVLGVVEVKAPQFSGGDESGHHQLDVGVGKVVPQVHEAGRTLSESLGQEEGGSPILHHGGVEGGLVGLVLREEAPARREVGVDPLQ